MNFLGGGERHSSADYSTSRTRSADPHTAPPGLPQGLLGRPGDVRNFIHRSFIGRAVGGIVSSVVGSVPIVGGLASGIFDRLRGAGQSTVPQVTGCPPGFINTGAGCVPRSPVASVPLPLLQPRILGPGAGVGQQFGQDGGADRTRGGLPPVRSTAGGLTFGAGAPGEAVMGRFGAGFEPDVIMTDTRRCGRGAVLGIDGLCYNRRDLRNSDRFWPRGRRPLLTGGEMRAISTASSAAKKLQRKEKQLQELGLLKRPARGRRAAPAGHRATLTHDGGSQH